MKRKALTWAMLVCAAIQGRALAQGDKAATDRLDQVTTGGFTYRNLGPFRAGSWIADIAVPDSPAKSHLDTFYVASRNGGLWKTINNGTTFTCVFPDPASAAAGALLSMGAVTVAPSDENILWLGTGDASCTRSATRGEGIYKSTDAGKTWQKMGLDDTQHISRIVIDPTHPDTVIVAAMGHLFSPNDQRGIFKTTDGGKTWKKTLYINDHTGVIDLVMNHRDPKTLYAATYECMRDPWRLVDGGPDTGIYKSTDGGDTWSRLQNGLPTGDLGRIGLDLYQKDPTILYAMVDNRNPVSAVPPADAGGGPGRGRGRGGGGGGGPSLVGGEMYRSADAGATWTKMNAARDDLSRKSGYAFNQVRVSTDNPDGLFITGSSMASSDDGGKTWTGLNEGPGNRAFRRAFGDFRTIWIDPTNSDRMLAGSDGGVFESYDGGRTCEHFMNLQLGEVYALTVDMESPYNIYEGLQDHESWKGPSNGWSGEVGIEDWSTVGIGDGMYNLVDPSDSRWVYNTQEFGRMARLDQKTRIRTTIAPPQPADTARLRFNWVAPIAMSPHDSKTVYSGAQFLFRSKDRGDHWERISPDLTTNDASKISPPSAAIQFCTITTLSESPAKAGVIWVGTDDGKVQVTQDAGATWTDVTGKITAAGPQGTQDAWTTRVCASPSAPGTAYVAKSRYRQDDFRPFLFKTTDFGQTWTNIAGNLPARSVQVVYEDPVKPSLLFAGDEIGVYVSVDSGGHWSPLRGNMPPAHVTDLTVHPREGDLVVGTFGRGTWVTDIRPLREIDAKLLDGDVHFFAVHERAPEREGALGNYRLYGDRIPTTPNSPSGPVFEYYLHDTVPGRVTITLADAGGNVVRTLNGSGNAGLNRINFSARGGFGGGGGGRGGAAANLPEGDYTITLHVGDKTFTQKAKLSFTPPIEEGQGEDDG